MTYHCEICIPTTGYSLGIAPEPTLVSVRGRLTVKRIQEVVSAYFDIDEAEMRSSRRGRDVARPRQVAMYLARKLTPKSLPDIGRRFGGRDHTTVLHATRVIEALMAIDGEIATDVELLTKRLAA